MAIYTRFGSRVQFTSARLVPVWITIGNIGNGMELKWHYSLPKRTSKWRNDVRIEHIQAWHVNGRYDDDRPGNGGNAPFAGERCINDFVADGAIQEIIAECHRLNPEDAMKERQIVEVQAA